MNGMTLLRRAAREGSKCLVCPLSDWSSQEEEVWAQRRKERKCLPAAIGCKMSHRLKGFVLSHRSMLRAVFEVITSEVQIKKRVNACFSKPCVPWPHLAHRSRPGRQTSHRQRTRWLSSENPAHLKPFFLSRGQILEVWEQSRWLHVRCEDACGELLDLITLAQERLRREYRLVRVVQYVCASLWSTFTTPIYLSNKEEVQIFGATGNHIQNALQAF